MKNKLYIITALVMSVGMLFTSCSKSDDVTSKIVFNFAQEQYGIPLSNKVDVKVLSTASVHDQATVSYKIISNLEEGKDYKISDTEFTFTAGSRESNIEITFLRQLNEDDNIVIQLTNPSLGSIGIGKATIALSDSEAHIYTFEKENYTMTQTAEVSLALSGLSGSFIAEEDIILEVEVDASSTAVLGTHFEFDNDNTITIPAGSNKGKIKLNLLEQEADKDLIVLKLKNPPAQLKPGNYESTAVVIFGSMYDKLMGAWQYVAFTNEEWLELNTQYSDDPATLPRNNGNTDTLVFGDEGLKTALNGDLKKYFRDTQLSFIKEEIEVLQEIPGFPPKRENITLVRGLANVAFSTEVIDEREAEIGFRVFKDGEDEILEVTIRDYEPVDFLKNTYEMYKNFGDDPVMKSMPLRYHFVRLKNVK